MRSTLNGLHGKPGFRPRRHGRSTSKNQICGRTVVMLLSETLPITPSPSKPNPNRPAETGSGTGDGSSWIVSVRFDKWVLLAKPDPVELRWNVSIIVRLVPATTGPKLGAEEPPEALAGNVTVPRVAPAVFFTIALLPPLDPKVPVPTVVIVSPAANPLTLSAAVCAVKVTSEMPQSEVPSAASWELANWAQTGSQYRLRNQSR